MTMSALQSPPALPPHSLHRPPSSSNAAEQFSKQQRLQMTALQSSDPLVPSESELRLATQLAHLASQHHTSEYNIVKFGPRGSSMTYIPISIQLPSHVKELRKRQATCSDRDPWWPPIDSSAGRPKIMPSRRSGISLNEAAEEVEIEEAVTSQALSHALNVNLHNSDLLKPSFSPCFQQELSLALSTDMSLRTHQIQMQLKTSKSHPIQISPVIPVELLPMISAHLQPSEMRVSTVFDLPPSMQLDRLTMPPSRSVLFTPKGGMCIQPNQNRFSRPFDSPPPIFWNPCIPASPLNAIQTPLSTQEITAPPLQVPTPYSANVYQIMPLPIPILSPHDPFGSSPQSFSPASPRVPTPPPPSPARRPSLSRFPPSILGNLLLSSCPGKKVRLTGPVKGRGAICRDLETDLERIKSLGIKCIVCCLDDDELEFLGANWGEYSSLAKKLGLNILRVPMPEGLSPEAVAPFNFHLDTLIQNYTLRGMDVLVHCRGGVGRAGLVACCWMIKIGLCGWFPPVSKDSDGDHSMAPAFTERPFELPPVLREDTLDLVEKAIVVIRRRRSVKSIETYEQVKFLVEFVEFLRAGLDET